MTADAISRDLDLFEKAVTALAQRPSFMAHLLSMALAGDVSAARIAAELDCPATNAIRVALMRVPRSDREMFRNDVARIAEAAGVDQVRLLTLIRQAQSLIAFEADRLAGDRQGELLAARDVMPGTDEQEG
jgi:hypothetical protein